MTTSISSSPSLQSTSGNEIGMYAISVLRKLSRLKEYPRITLKFHLTDGIQIVKHSTTPIEKCHYFPKTAHNDFDLSLLPRFIEHVVNELKLTKNPHTIRGSEIVKNPYNISNEIIKELSKAIVGLKTVSDVTYKMSSTNPIPMDLITSALEQLEILKQQWVNQYQSSYFSSFPFEKNETTDSPFQRINQITEENKRLEEKNKVLYQKILWLNRQVDFLKFDQKRFTQRIRELIEENERLKTQIHSKDRSQHFDYIEKIRSIHFSSKM